MGVLLSFLANPLARRVAIIAGVFVLVALGLLYVRQDAARDERNRQAAARDRATLEVLEQRNDIEKENRDATDLDLCIRLGRPDCGL